jgi:hypothetical protein
MRKAECGINVNGDVFDFDFDFHSAFRAPHSALFNMERVLQ